MVILEFSGRAADEGGGNKKTTEEGEEEEESHFGASPRRSGHVVFPHA